MAIAGGKYGFAIPGVNHCLLRFRVGPAEALSELDGRRVVNLLYVIAGLISLALFVYLIVALLRPEVF